MQTARLAVYGQMSSGRQCSPCLPAFQELTCLLLDSLAPHLQAHPVAEGAPGTPLSSWSLVRCRDEASESGLDRRRKLTSAVE